MKKILIITLLSSTLLLTACAKEVKESKNTTSNNLVTNKIEKNSKVEFPTIEDFKIEITEPLELSGEAYYGKFRLSNNSKFNIKSWQTLYRNEQEEEVILTIVETLTPGETSVEETIFSDEGNIDIYNSKPIYTEVVYIDSDGEENYYKYDYKLESYENY